MEEKKGITKVVVPTVFLKGLVEDLDRATSLIDVATQYLQDYYDGNKDQLVMTPFQIASMLELVDGALLTQRETFQKIVDSAEVE